MFLSREEIKNPWKFKASDAPKDDLKIVKFSQRNYCICYGTEAHKTFPLDSITPYSFKLKVMVN